MAPDGIGTQNIRTTPVIRANPAQTAILKKAFQLSNVPTPEQLQALSGETNLPSRWINQWFGRQRLKDRKKSKTTAGTDVSVRTSSQETLHVKKEIIEASLLSSLSSPAILSGNSENLSASGSTSSVAGNRASSSVNQNRNEKTAAVKPPGAAARVSRSKPITEAKTARSESSEVENDSRPPTGSNLRTSAVQPSGSVLVSVLPNSLGTLPSSSKFYNNELPMISPPKRSSRASESQESAFRSNRDHASLSTAQDGAYMPASLDGFSSRVQDDTACSSSSFVPRRRSKSQKSAVYNQGPVFRTQFHNNGPSDYSPYHQDNSVSSIRNPQYMDCGPSAMNNSTFNDFYYQGSSNPDAQSSMHQHDHFGNRYVTRPLAPAFDWENHVPSDPSTFSSVTYDHRTFQQPQEVYGQQSFYNNEGYYHYEQGSYPHPQVKINVRVQGQFEDLTEPMNANMAAHDAVVNPYVAPLRHLTDILGAYRDEHGTYTRLMDEQERPALTRHLLNENLLERSPFQAAMGLSLMSKLGWEWEY